MNMVIYLFGVSRNQLILLYFAYVQRYTTYCTKIESFMEMALRTT